jgi:beta-glucosidase
MKSLIFSARFLVAALLFCGVFSVNSAAQTTPATEPTPEQMSAGPAPAGKPWEPAYGYWKAAPTAWIPTHNGYVAAMKKGPSNIVFFGDSITNGWGGDGKAIWAEKYAPLGAINIGIGGDTTRNLLWRMDHGALDGATPKLVIVMIGVNNIFTGNGTPEEIAQGIDAVVKEVHAKVPDAKILLLSVLPNGNGGVNEKSKQIDALISKLDVPNGKYLDLTDKFSTPDGKIITNLYRPDGTHLLAPGYQVWADAMQADFDEMSK